MLLFYPILLAAYAAVLVIDLLQTFVIVRLLGCWLHAPLVLAVNQAGQPVVDRLRQMTSRHCHRLGWSWPFSEKKQLALVLIELLVLRMVAAAILRLAL